ncbi:MAG TPA: N-acetylmuramoyl-L-alanine amidase [Candidatus Sumerlaeota bacterium]|nr:N-acetylmuramoyl-L-alanine amidase [Candidatus Sumerlaeota bacterium]HPS00074.1 N-acetylmuramoyl-L-alanine amidase [Candidatus Sumerlaeota bacterium]
MTTKSRRLLPLWGILALVSLWSGGLASPGLAATLSEKNIVRSSNATHNRIEIQLDQPVDVRVVDQIANEKQPYFFVDLYRTKADFADKIIPIQDGIVKGLQILSYADQNVVRIVFFPNNRTIFRVSDKATGYEYPLTALTATSLPAERKQSLCLVIDTPKDKTIPLPVLETETGKITQRPKVKGAKRLVVLDPGHGGSDPGAQSILKFGGSILDEKKVALAIAQEVQRLLNKTPNVTAELTHSSDKHMTLQERVDMAEGLDADLVVSIHANSSQYHNSDSARGAEFYYFSEDSKNEHKKLVEAENTPDEIELTAESNAKWKAIKTNLIKDILARNRGEGAQACEKVNEAFSEDPYFKKYNRGVKSAPFRVLMNIVSPSILVEVGFIDHKEESALLADTKFQKRIAKLIANGILRTFAQTDKDFVYYQFPNE